MLLIVFKFCFAHLNINRRRKVMLEHFKEPCSSEITEEMGQYCDVCSQTSDTEVVHYQMQLHTNSERNF